MRGRPHTASVALAALAVFIAAAPADETATPVTITREGFRPDTLNVRKGELVRLRVTSGDDEHCFALDAYRVEKRVRPGRSVLVEFTPDRAGKFEVHCCLEPRDKTPRATLIVGE